METFLLNSNHFNAIEKQVIVLLYSCPFGEPATNCFLFKARKTIKFDYKKAIDSCSGEEKNQLIYEHKMCLFERVNGIDIESIKKNNCSISKEAAFLLWTKKINIGILTTELKKRGWIKSQFEFSTLFDNKKISKKIYWNMQFKYELAYLLYKLKEGGFIHSTNTKGYFKFAENNIFDFSDNKLPKNTLKFLCFKILNNPLKYSETIEEVDRIINGLTTCSNNY